MTFSSDARVLLVLPIETFEPKVSKNLEHGITTCLPASSRDTKPGVLRNTDVRLSTSVDVMTDRRRSSSLKNNNHKSESNRPQRRTSIGSSVPEKQRIVPALLVVDDRKMIRVTDALKAFESTISSNREHGFTTILPASCTKSSAKVADSVKPRRSSPRDLSVLSSERVPLAGFSPSAADAAFCGYDDLLCGEETKTKRLMPSLAPETSALSSRNAFLESQAAHAKRRNSLSSTKVVTSEREDYGYGKQLISTINQDAETSSHNVAPRQNSLTGTMKTSAREFYEDPRPSAKKISMVPRSIDPLSRSSHASSTPSRGPRRIARRRNSLNGAAPARQSVSHDSETSPDWSGATFHRVADSLSRSAPVPRRIARRSVKPTLVVDTVMEDFAFFDFDEQPCIDDNTAGASQPLTRPGTKKSAGRIANRKFRKSSSTSKTPASCTAQEDSSQSTEDTAELTGSSQHSSKGGGHFSYNKKMVFVSSSWEGEPERLSPLHRERRRLTRLVAKS